VEQLKIGEKVFHKKGDYEGDNGIIIDSGSTFSYFPFNQWILFRGEIDRRCKESDRCQLAVGITHKCYHLTKTSKQSELEDLVEQLFPSIDIRVG